jgi:hypothetical protein
MYEVAGNFARPTKFTAIINFPPNLFPILSSSELDILCKTVNIPSIQNVFQEIKVKGHLVKVPVRTEYNKEINLTFYVDEWFKVKKDFEEWIKALDNRFDSYDDCPDDLESEDKYGTITVIGQDYLESGEEPHPIEITYTHVFPTNISDMNFSSEDKDNVMELSVTFAYLEYTIKD